MRNFTPLLNTINLARNSSPFATAGTSIVSNSLRSGTALSKLGGSKITLSGLINGAQKTIGTVNQIVPLYNQVKPMFNNAKTALNIFKNVKNINNTPIVNETPKINNNLEIPKNNIAKEEKVIINKLNPNKPFFV
jgi:hypothetical protein